MIVMDCSAAVNIARETGEGLAAQALMLEGEECIAPTLLYSEATNVLATLERAGVIQADQAMPLLKEALSLPDRFVSTEKLWIEAFSEARRLRHPAYDMLYAVLARRNGATLFTLDQKLQKLCLENGIECIYTDTEFN